jgi:D-alanine-D-alanine ligase-like ATP-grasp enzyme
MHAAIPQLGVVNWDFTIDPAGNPVLIEANCKNGSVWLPQMAHGVAAFGERTAEVLQWLRFMKKLRPHERVHYVGGYTD